jgi:hypothetical protein
MITPDFVLQQTLGRGHAVGEREQAGHGVLLAHKVKHGRGKLALHAEKSARRLVAEKGRAKGDAQRRCSAATGGTALP